MMNRKLIGTTLLLLATSLGAAPVQAGEEDRDPRSRAAAEARAERAQRIADELGLSDEQRKEFRAIMADSRQRAAQIQRDMLRERREARKAMMALRDETRGRMDELLTAEQRQKLDRMRQQAMQRQRESMEGAKREGPK